MDCRRRTKQYKEDWTRFTVTVDTEEGELTLPAKVALCSTCDGQGFVTNPEVDESGITGEMFAEDPDFAADYFRGSFNIKCPECGRRGRVLVPAEGGPQAEAFWGAVRQAQDDEAADYHTRLQENGGGY